MKTALELWDEMAAEPDVSGEIRRLLTPESAYSLYLTQTRPAGDFGMLATFEEPPGTLWRKLRPANGWDVRVDARPGHPASLHLTEKDRRFHPMFGALVDDLKQGLGRLESLPAEDRSLALDFVAGRILKWQAAMKAQSDGLSAEQRAGLFGELWLLEHVLKWWPALNAVSGWTGPDRKVQDFQYEGTAVEVKASRQSLPTAVRISSERQLDNTNTDQLFLLHVALDERSDGAGATLPDAVGGVRAAVGADSEARLVLDDALADYGYLDGHAPLYEDRSYAVRAIDIFQVVNGFPRIIEADLKPGLGSVSYSLTLAACEPFRTTLEALRTRLGGHG